ncbi:MAG: TonB-dependent receptor [Hyphomicrobiales bacterium]|nr:TonB-dependent receptor [Hyphomicrobiales bacterium]
MCAQFTRGCLRASSAFALLAFTAAASAQPPATPSPSEAPQPGAPASTEAPPANAPTSTPSTTLPEVKVQAQRRRPSRPRSAHSAGADQRTPAAPSQQAPQSTRAASPFNPPFAPLSTITSTQIQESTTTNFGDLFFTKPGATSAGLAPGAARPVLRGLSDARVRIQENGVGSGDVSDLGQDHGVPIDPLAVQRTEVFRGPAALRFGSQAVGGVVEATNNRIPTVAPPGGMAAELRSAGTTVNNGWESGLLLDAGGRNAAIHADVYGRGADDYRIPSYPYLFAPDPAPAVNGRQPNSSLRTEGAAVGGSYLFDGGYAGIAISRFASDYHVPGLEAAASQTYIKMEQTKLTSRGEYRPESLAIAAVRYWAGYTDYKHDEIGLNDIGVDQIAATFKNHQSEGKVELETVPMITPLGALTSIVGSQLAQSHLDTSGEALLFPARTRTAAGYFFNEMQHTRTLRTQLAGRLEQVAVTSTAVAFPPNFLPPPDDPASAPADLTFLPKSISFSAIKELPWSWAASVTLQRIERAPRAVELFSKGPHDATQTFDIGNPGLKIETARTAEIGIKRAEGAFHLDAKAYYTRYDDFIFQQPTGTFCGEEFATCGTGTELLQTFIGQRDAIFRGAELAWQWDASPLANGVLGLDGQFDTVRATFTDGSNVPRMPPTRVGGGVSWRNDSWFLRMGLLHAFAQTDVGAFETPTAGYNLLKMEIVHRTYWQYSPWGPIEVTTGIAGDNLLDVDVRNSVQFHKDEILQPGRNSKFFLNVKYGADKPDGPPGSFKALGKGRGPAELH